MEVAEEVVIGEEGGGWQPDDIRQPGEIQLPLGLSRQGIETVDDLLTRHPELQRSIEEMSAGPLADGTMKNYKGMLKKLQEFCRDKKYDYNKLTEATILHFLAELNDKGARYAALNQVKPAIVLLLEMQTGSASAFTKRADRWLEAAKRKASKKRQPTRKAGEVTLGMLKAMVDKYITPFKDNIGAADIFKLRAVTKMVVEYFTFCRFADYKELQAKHFEEIGVDLLVTFPSSKNDQYHNGQSTLLKRNGSDLCPVRIVKIYFKRLGFKFGSQGGDTSYLHCVIRKRAGSRYADGRQAASQATSREEMTATLLDMGFNPVRITDKSFKMLGVTEALRAGMTLEQVAQHGRWRTTEMPLRYKHNSMDYKADLASRIPFEERQEDE